MVFVFVLTKNVLCVFICFGGCCFFFKMRSVD